MNQWRSVKICHIELYTQPNISEVHLGLTRKDDHLRYSHIFSANQNTQKRVWGNRGCMVMRKIARQSFKRAWRRQKACGVGCNSVV